MIYDSVFCGGGPLNLLLAISRHQKGEKVLIIDENAALGGAWKSFKFNDQWFEIGCHIMDRHKKVHHFIANNMGIPMEPLSIKPTILKKGKHIPYDYKNNVFYLRKKIQFLKNGKLKSFFYDKHNLSKFQFYPRNYAYPKGGSQTFLSTILEKIEALGIDIKLNTKVISITTQDNHHHIIDSNDIEISCKRLIMTPFTALKSYSYQNKPYKMEYKPQNFRHILVTSNDHFIKPFSYVRVMDHDIIHRMSPQYSTDGKRYYLFGILDHGNREKLAEELMPEITKFLTHEGYITNHELHCAYDYRYPTEYMSAHTVALLRSTPNIQVNFSTNLIYSMHFHWDEIKEAF